MSLARQWPGLLLAGLLPGLLLALGLSGWFAWFGPGGLQASNKFQLTMWLVPLFWLPSVCLCWLWPRAWQAWAWLAAAAVLVWLGLWLARRFLA